MIQSVRSLAAQWAEAADQAQDAADELGRAHERRNRADERLKEIRQQIGQAAGIALGDRFSVAFDDHVVNVQIIDGTERRPGKDPVPVRTVTCERVARL